MKSGIKKLKFPLLLFFCLLPPLTVSRQETEFPIQSEKVLGKERYQAALTLIEAYQERYSSSTIACEGRLTLTTATPVTTSDVTAATTVYYTPFNGDRIALYTGSSWTALSFTEKSVAVPATTTTPFDIFAYDNSGTLALETVNWTSDTSRSVSISKIDGVYLKGTDLTRRYLGTVRTTSVSGETEDSQKRRLVWNNCNRMPRTLLAVEPTASWDYSTATWRSANGNSTVGETRVEYLIGLRTEMIKLKIWVPSTYAAAPNGSSVGIGINSTSTNSAILYGANNDNGIYPGVPSIYQGLPTLGFSYAQWLEINDGTVTWYGTLSDADEERAAGLTGTVWQ